MRGLMRILAKRAVMLPLIVLAVLALGALVARAGTPTITDVTTPPAGHFAGACSSCHTVVAVDPSAPREGVDGTDDETGTVKVDGANNDSETVDAQGDHHDGHNDTDTEGDQGDHETVAPGMHDRGDQSGDQGDSAGDQQGDQGDPAPAPRVAHVQHHSGSSDQGNGGMDEAGHQGDGSGN